LPWCGGRAVARNPQGDGNRPRISGSRPEMRIALHHTSEVALRAGRVLLAERDLITLGVIDKDTPSSDRRVERAGDLAAYDAVLTDADDETLVDVVERAAAAGVSCVVWADADDLAGHDAFAETTLLLGSNVARGLAPCLAAHEAALLPEETDRMIAWTEPGRPLRRGEAISFPEPVGTHWAERRDDRGPGDHFAAPIEGDWAGALAKVTADSGVGTVTNVVGIADLGVHIEALALAAGAILVARSEFPHGVHRATAAAEPYLLAALRAGLDVAVHRSV